MKSFLPRRGGGGDEWIFSHKLPGLAESILRFKEYLQKVLLFKYIYIYIYIGKEKKTVVYYLAAGIMLFKHSLFLWHSFLMGHSIIRLLKIVQIFSENFPSGALCLLSFFLNTVNKLFLAFLIGTSLTLIVSYNPIQPLLG